MKITNIKHYLVHPDWRKNLIYVKVEFDNLFNLQKLPQV